MTQTEWNGGRGSLVSRTCSGHVTRSHVDSLVVQWNQVHHGADEWSFLKMPALLAESAFERGGLGEGDGGRGGLTWREVANDSGSIY